ncbi:hypothetical protein [Ilyobacter polytropus]|uniref:Lipoprotein n=1 Tax=Ilyobacter polytropus (strain ATCC 51220 / DSM 2926 / LMG 16218 / CuHBu1) TaxID=572544 RepID=E3HCC3_ILYPC|nr:hypothetical protein [Ilyobacter polytropus]ADO84383.1 hypothetical protein Ilyop_2626 [Ilyobacter polytropus DSM 2926]
MKKLMILFITIILVVILSCNEREDNTIELTVKGDFPQKGKAIAHLYGYDKNLPDETTALITIKKININENPLYFKMEFPKDAYEVINSNQSKKEDIEFFITVDLDINEDEDIDYTQDFGGETLLRVIPGMKKDISVKKI